MQLITFPNCSAVAVPIGSRLVIKFRGTLSPSSEAAIREYFNSHVASVIPDVKAILIDDNFDLYTLEQGK